MNDTEQQQAMEQKQDREVELRRTLAFLDELHRRADQTGYWYGAWAEWRAEVLMEMGAKEEML